MIAARAHVRVALAAAVLPVSAGCIDTATTARDDDTTADAAPSTPAVVERTVEVVLHRPQAIFLLDTSGSMSARLGEEGPTRLEVLAGAITDTLGEFDEVDLGAVFFGHEVKETIPVSPAASAPLLARLEGGQAEGGGTRYVPPLAAASALFAAAPPAARFVLFATDGAPDPSQDDGRGEVERLRSAGVTIFSLFLGDGDDESARALLLSLSGPADRAADPRFAAQAADAAALARALADFATWVRDGACRFTLPDDAPAADAVELLIRSDGLETPISLVAAEALHDRPAPVFAPAPEGDTATGREYALSWAACAPAMRADAELIVRWLGP